MKIELADKPKKSKKVVFYSFKASQAVLVPLLDENGEKKVKKDKRGNEVWLGNEPAYITRAIKFECISSSPSKGTLSIYESEDPAVIAHLNALALDPTNDIITETDYQKSRNRESFEKGIENERLKQENISKNTEIEDLKRQLSQAEKKGSGSAIVKEK